MVQVVQGTFGIALLSKYPLLNPQTFYMYSEGEQTATIRAQIDVDGMSYNLFVTHLGNGGPMVQQEAILTETAGLENVILMGDFNFRPDTEQYQHTVALLDDAWLSFWPGGDDVARPRRAIIYFIAIS
jgi:endonuclease/exonuclease/phosphatase family metal-dependent hydrolase